MKLAAKMMGRGRWQWLLISLSLLLMAGAACGESMLGELSDAAEAEGPPGVAAQVVRVIDGDTIDVQIGRDEYRVRYIGVDAPERGEPLYQEATAANGALVADRTVYLVQDISDLDRFGRLLRYVYLADGRLVNGELVRQGMAEAKMYRPDVAFHLELEALQAEAQAAGLGLWAR